MKTKYPKTQTLEICIKDFQNGLDTETAENITSFNTSVNCYNFDYKSGALTESIGFENLTIPSTTEENSAEKSPQMVSGTKYIKIGTYKQFDTTENKRNDKLIAITSENKVHFCRLVTPYPAMLNIDDKTFLEVPNLFNHNDGTYDCILFTSESDGVNSWDDLTATKNYPDMPVVSNICNFKDRFFITLGGERLVIRTQYGNLLTWKKDDVLSVEKVTLDGERGSINKLICMDDYIYAIRDYGISRIMWYESMQEFDINHLLFSGGKIYGDTACCCGKTGLVLCKDGLYQFDTANAKKLDLKLNSMLKGIANQHAVAIFRNGIYYLACRLNFGDEKIIGCESENYKNNAIIAYEVATGKYTITRGIDVISFCAVQFESNDKLLACFNAVHGEKIGQLVENGKTFGENQFRYWRSPLSDLGYSNKEKSVREISLFSKYDAKLTVFTEKETREFDVKGSEILSKFPVRIKGKQVGIAISSSTEKAFISNVKLTVDLLDTEYV
ncbi:MAG: hypothetical protein ACI4TZ_04155 [Christensenellales bacterium]